MCKRRVLRELAVYLRKEERKLLGKSERSVFLLFQSFFLFCVCHANSCIVRLKNWGQKKLGDENVYYFRAFFCSWISKSIFFFFFLFLFSFHCVVWQIHLLRAYKRDDIFHVFFFPSIVVKLFSLFFFYNRTSVTRISR